MKTIRLDDFENTDKYIQAIKNTPPNIAKLKLHQKAASAVEHKNILNAIPDSISALDLRDNGLCLFSGNDLKTAFEGLPRMLGALNLCANGFSLLPGNDLKTAFKGLPATLGALDLSENDLHNLSRAELRTAFEGLPRMLGALDLSANVLQNLSSAGLRTAFEGLPTMLGALNLSANVLQYLSGAELRTAFEGLPTMLGALNLSENDLHNLSGTELRTAFEGLPTMLGALNLSENDLHNLSGAELRTAFEGLPTTLNALNLSKNKLQNFTTIEFDHLKHFFDKCQKFTLTVSYDEVKAMDDDCREAFKRATKNVSVDYVDKNEKNLAKTSYAEIRKAARLLAQLARTSNTKESLLVALPAELFCMIAAQCRDPRVHLQEAALKIAADNFNRNVFKFPTPNIDKSTPRKFLEFLSDLVDYSMKIGGSTICVEADNKKHGEPLLKDLKQVLTKMGNAKAHPTIPYRPHVYLEAALNKIDAHIRYGLAKIYSNSNTAQFTEGEFGTFEVRFCRQLNRLVESNIKQENYTAENSDQFVTDTLAAFRRWMTDGPIHNEKKQLEQHRIPMTENEHQYRMI